MAVSDLISEWTGYSDGALEQLAVTMDLYMGKQCLLTIPSTSCKKKETQATSSHWNFLLTLDSNLTVELNGEPLQSGNGNLYVIPPQTAYKKIQHQTTSCYYSLLVERTWMEHCAQQVLGVKLPSTWRCESSQNASLRFLLRKFMEIASRQNASPEMFSAVEMLLLDALLGSPVPTGFVGQSVVYPESLALVIEKIHHRRGMDLKVADLAHLAAMSERTFLRKFREITGMSPKQYILSHRMTLARMAMDQDPGKSLAQVAQEHGFYNLPHFSRLFSRFFGFAPKNAKNASD
jgi:AraC-like DNA-binding protein